MEVVPEITETAMTGLVGADTAWMIVATALGLVAVTPAAGFVGPMSALLLGAIAAVPSYFAIMSRARTRLDDSLEVAAAHGLGGLVGALLTGVFAAAAWGGVDGLLHGDGRQFLIQGVAVLAALAYSGVMTLGLLKLVAVFVPLRVGDAEERRGLDVPLHGEEAYSDGEGAILVLPQVGTPAPRPATSASPSTAASPAGAV